MSQVVTGWFIVGFGGLVRSEYAGEQCCARLAFGRSSPAKSRGKFTTLVSTTLTVCVTHASLRMSHSVIPAKARIQGIFGCAKGILMQMRKSVPRKPFPPTPPAQQCRGRPATTGSGRGVHRVPDQPPLQGEGGGKATTPSMRSSPASSMTSRSTPSAMPAQGARWWRLCRNSSGSG